MLSSRKQPDLDEAVAHPKKLGVESGAVVADHGTRLLFASDVGRHITGQILAVDGGVLAV